MKTLVYSTTLQSDLVVPGVLCLYLEGNHGPGELNYSPEGTYYPSCSLLPNIRPGVLGYYPEGTPDPGLLYY